ncbi:unnamed protein product [Mytilus coruscus]|uniref:Uncharacterized protein n=1 Tax=Mytilus coruscus TaxID=42192 RepID=A0A6J8CPH2_MYTCO|nr:unnamed protein product [Mytilus coruscus]
MLKRTEIHVIIIVYTLLEQTSGQTLDFGENKLHQELHKSTRVRVRSCHLGSSAECQYCDCYGDACSTNEAERKINHFYNGIFVTKNEFRKMLQLGSNHKKVGKIKKFKTAVSSRSCEHKFRGGGCCETVITHIEPLQIELDGVIRTVVRADGNTHLISNQTIETGKCRRCSESTCRCGPNNESRCMEEKFITHILVFAENNNFEYEFIFYEFSRFCRCVHT